MDPIEMYYVVTPLNTNYRAGDSGGDMTIHEAPEAAYYESKEVAVEAAKVVNEQVLASYAASMKPYDGGDPEAALAEQGAFVVQVVWDPVAHWY